MQRQFESTLERAQTLKGVVTKMVSQSLNRQRSVSLREALREPDLQDLLVTSMIASGAILEVAVVDPHNEILFDSDPNRLGVTSPPYPDFQPVVFSSSWSEKLDLLLRPGSRYYQLEQPIGTPELKPLLFVRMIIYPALIRNDINPTLRKNARVAVLSVIGAVCLTFLLSAVAFRPLGQLGHMLDLVARGEFEPEKEPSAQAARHRRAFRDGFQSQHAGAAACAARSTRSPTCAATSTGCCRIWRMRSSSSTASCGWCSLPARWRSFWARSASELPGKTFGDVFPPNTTLGLLIAQAAQTGRPVRNRRVPWPSHRRWECRAAVVLLSVDFLESLPGTALTGSGLLVRLRDPEAQRKIGRELQTADRLAAISRITGGVAHEVKNPLNAILLHVEVARAKLSRGETDIAPQMEIISREILRLDRVVKTFLDFTRPVELNLSNVPLQRVAGGDRGPGAARRPSFPRSVFTWNRRWSTWMCGWIVTC